MKRKYIVTYDNDIKKKQKKTIIKLSVWKCRNLKVHVESDIYNEHTDKIFDNALIASTILGGFKHNIHNAIVKRCGLYKNRYIIRYY